MPTNRFLSKQYAAPLLFFSMSAIVVLAFLKKKKEDNARFNFKKYLNEIGLPDDIKLESSIETLHLIVSHHAMHIPYQNISLHMSKKDGHPLPLSVDKLEEKLLDNHQGGMCYESSELLWQALNHIGFQVQRIETYPLNGKAYDPAVPSTHNILLVEHGAKRYLVDASYGYNGIRFPIELKPGTSFEVRFPQNERYQVLFSSDHYQLNMWMEDKAEWFSLYRFNNPITFIDYEATVQNNIRMLMHTGILPIRDQFIKIGRMTLFGRIGYNIDVSQRPPTAFKLSIDKGNIKKTTYTSEDQAQLVEDIQNTLGIDASPAFKL